MGAGRGGAGMSRGGSRGGSQMGSNRGMSQNRGRGGMHGSGRGSLGHSGGSMRGSHHNRDRGNIGNYNQRGGGSSFSSGRHDRQNNASFRGRGGAQVHGGFGRNARSDGFHNRSQAAGSSSANALGKRDENRRTLTDFKIIGLELSDLGWQWGQISSPQSEDKSEKDGEEKKQESEGGKENTVSKTEDAQLELIVTSETEASKETRGGNWW